MTATAPEVDLAAAAAAAQAIPARRMPRRGPRPAPTKTKVAAWPPETKARALEVYAEHGLAAAHADVGVPKGTIRNWAKAAGVDASAAHARAGVHVQRATEASVRSRRQAVAEAREQLVSAQAEIALRASRLEIEILDAHLELVQSTKGGAPSVEALSRLQAALSGPRLTEIVGSRTRAIHDLQLLDGKATEQPEGGLTIRFAAPLPDAGAAPLIVTMDGDVLEGDG